MSLVSDGSLQLATRTAVWMSALTGCCLCLCLKHTGDVMSHSGIISVISTLLCIEQHMDTTVESQSHIAPFNVFLDYRPCVSLQPCSFTVERTSCYIPGCWLACLFGSRNPHKTTAWIAMKLGGRMKSAPRRNSFNFSVDSYKIWSQAF